MSARFVACTAVTIPIGTGVSAAEAVMTVSSVTNSVAAAACEAVKAGNEDLRARTIASQTRLYAATASAAMSIVGDHAVAETRAQPRTMTAAAMTPAA